MKKVEYHWRGELRGRQLTPEPDSCWRPAQTQHKSEGKRDAGDEPPRIQKKRKVKSGSGGTNIT